MREIWLLMVPLFAIRNGLSGQALIHKFTVPSWYGYPTATVREIMTCTAHMEWFG